MVERTGLHTPRFSSEDTEPRGKEPPADKFTPKKSPKKPLGEARLNTPSSSAEGTPQKNKPSASASAASASALDDATLPPPFPPPKETQKTISILEAAQDIPAIGDKIGKNIQLVYQHGAQWVFNQPMPRSTRACIMFFETPKKTRLMGGVSCTPRGEKGFELEYGKHPEYEGTGFGSLAVGAFLHELPTINQLGHFGIDPTQVYAEVSSQEGLNMPSYLTLLKSGFIPIARETGDGIRWVHPNANFNPRDKHQAILDAYTSLKQATTEQKDSASAALRLALQTIINSHT